MALTGLLVALRPLHGWNLSLWHGDHGWRAEAASHAQALAAWAATQGLPLHLEQAQPIPGSEAEARHWRYGCLRRQAEALGCRHVLTGHTASDRTETLLLHLARGCHRKGLASLQASRPLADGLQLVRPLLPFSRQDTSRICAEQGLPVWIDATNEDPRFSRNRLRAEVLPVLEDLHPGATTRIAAMAERLAQEEDQAEELVAMVLDSLAAPAKPELGEGEAGLDRRGLLALQPANQGRVLQSWLRRHWGKTLQGKDLELLLSRMRAKEHSGRQDLAHGWILRWDGLRVSLQPPRQHPTHHGDHP
jgi:tRNA(Ile)-lysidine synthase